MRSLPIPELPTFVEETTLPRILVRTKGKQTRYYAYVNGYVCGSRCIVKGSAVIPLYYLSLVAMPGEGAKLQGVWAALASEHPQDVYLENVGTVVLAHHDPRLESLGYRLHWNYLQQPVRDRQQTLHAVIESHMLTLFDPIAGAAPPRHERTSQKGSRHKQRRQASRAERAVQLATERKELGDFEERLNREQFPCFLLLLPGNSAPLRQPEESDEQYQARRDAAVHAYLIGQHFAFLDRRAPWAMSMEWAEFLWKRGLAQQEIVPLKTWFYGATQRTEEEEVQPVGDEKEARQQFPLFEAAWLCRPNITRLQTDVRKALRAGRISNLRASTGVSAPVRTPEALSV